MTAPRRLQMHVVIFEPKALLRAVPVALVLGVAGSFHDPLTYVGFVLLVLFVAAAFAPIDVDVSDDGVSFVVRTRRWPLPAHRVESDPARVRGFALALYTLDTWKLFRDKRADKRARLELVTQDGAREVMRGLPAGHRDLEELVVTIDGFARGGS